MLSYTYNLDNSRLCTKILEELPPLQDNPQRLPLFVLIFTVDTVPPVCQCGNDVSQTTPLDFNGAIVNFQPCTATDNSGSVTVTSRSHSPGARFPPGITEVIYEFTDPSGNSVTCRFRVTVIEGMYVHRWVVIPNIVTMVTKFENVDIFLIFFYNFQFLICRLMPGAF